MLYRCIFTDDEYSELATDIDAVDDADALLKSEVLLAESGYPSLEIWLENRIVGYRAQVERIANRASERLVLLACLVGIGAFFALAIAVILGAI